MLIPLSMLVVVVAVLAVSTRTPKVPMDRDVVLRIRRLADNLHREQLLPYD
jgi:hypothetical protein